MRPANGACVPFCSVKSGTAGPAPSQPGGRTSGTVVGQPLSGHIGAVNGLAFSPDGSLPATAGRDGTLRRWVVGGG